MWLRELSKITESRAGEFRERLQKVNSTPDPFLLYGEDYVWQTLRLLAQYLVYRHTNVRNYQDRKELEQAALVEFLESFREAQYRGSKKRKGWNPQLGGICNWATPIMLNGIRQAAESKGYHGMGLLNHRKYLNEPVRKMHYELDDLSLGREAREAEEERAYSAWQRLQQQNNIDDRVSRAVQRAQERRKLQ